MTFDMVNNSIRGPFKLNDAIAYSVIRYGMQDRLFEAGRMDFGAIKSHLDVNPGLKREWEMAHSLVVGTPTTKERRSRMQTKWAKRIEALRLEGEVCSTAKLTLFVTQSKAMEELEKGPPAHQQTIESGGGPPADEGVEGKGLGIDEVPCGAVESSGDQPAGRLRQFDLPLR